MLHNFKKPLGIAAVVAGLGLAGIAYASSSLSEATLPARAADATPIETVSWALGGKTFAGESASYNADAFTSAEVTLGSGVASVGGRTAKPSADLNIPLSSTKNVPQGKDANYYVDFTVTPAAQFTPTEVSLQAWGVKFGGGAFAAELICEGRSYVITEQQKAARTQEDSSNASEAKDGYTFTFPVAGAEATTSSVTLRVYPYTTDTSATREIGFANVTVKGTVGEAGGEEEHFFTMPGTFAVPESATTDENYDFSGGLGVEGDSGNKNFCGAYDGKSVRFKNVYAVKGGTYKAVIPIDYSYGNSFMKIEVADAQSGAVEAVYNGGVPKNNSQYEPMDFPLSGKVTEGTKNVTISFTIGGTDRFVCNFRAPEFVWTGEGVDTPEIPAGWTAIPGELPVTGTGDGWSYSGGIKFENAEKGVGYIKDGCTSQKDFYCAEEGVYRMDWNIYSTNNGGDVTLTVTDIESGEVELTTTWNVSVKGDASQLLEGVITQGKKTLKLAFSNNGGYLFNYKTPTFVKVADEYAAIADVTVDGIASEAIDGFDWAFNLPQDYTAATTALKVAYTGGTIEAKTGEETLEVTDGMIALATPAAGTETVVNLTLTPAEGAIATKTEYAVRVFHIGDVMVKNVTVDGMEVAAGVIEALNSDASATCEGNIYTTLPEVKVTFADGTETIATGKLNGTTGSYSVTGTAGDKSRTFAIAVEGVHVYTATEADSTGEMKSNSGSKNDDGLWSNGVFTMTNNPDGYNESFKLGMKEYTIGMPANYVVKQLVFHNICSNYTNSRVRMESVVSEGATVYVPSTFSCVHSSEATPGNLIVNLEGHRAGAPITFKAAGGSQYLFWLEVVYEEVIPDTAPEVASTEITPTTAKNHAVVTLTFDRAMESAVASVNGETIAIDAEGSTVVRFSVWNLPWETTHRLTIAAGDAKDIYGNVTDKNIEVDIEVGAYSVDPTEKFIEVSTVAEWKAALEELKSLNNSADAQAAIVFIRNGEYDFGTEIQDIRGYNISFIGESRDGVKLVGQQEGISNPVVQTRNATNVHFENLTIQNNKTDGDDRRVAFYGGKKDVMVNVVLLGFHDTLVTGERGYYYDCRIEGGVDFICGGGDHYFDRCELVIIENGAKIVAPSTSTANRYGYVMNNCVISGDSKFDGSYYLGRPWQNEPRTFFLNTTMNIKPVAAGWDGMSSLTTYMYEYNSMDASGNAIDLSGRKNPSTSVNTYNPVLPGEYASHFIVENVLGGSDSWLATEGTERLEAPGNLVFDFEIVDGKPVLTDANHISWSPVKGAAGYMVYLNGEFAGYTPVAEFRFADASEAARVAGRVADQDYVSVRAVNAKGAPGESSRGVTTGIDDVAADSSDSGVRYFNLQGVEVGSDYRGMVIRVDAAGNAVKTVLK